MISEEPEELQSTIAINLTRVQERMAAACFRSGRKAGDVQLIVVSKSQPVEVIAAAIQAGARIFGENYAEQAAPKIIDFQGIPGLEWHMIGHVQSRKAGMVAQYFNYVHSMDSLKLAERLNSLAGERRKRLPILLEINLGGEESKGGWRISSGGRLDFAYSEFEQISRLPNLEIQGLMCMPPLSDKPEESRPYFQHLRNLRQELTKVLPNNPLVELSMGTSADYEIAIEEGATMVRVGQAILGQRPVKVWEEK